MLNSIKGILSGNKSQVGRIEKAQVFNEHAGAELLSYFQDQWAELHDNNEVNAKIAADLADTISKIHEAIAKDNEDISHIFLILNSTPNIKTSIENCASQIRTLHDSFANVEKGLFELENLIEKCELEDRKVEHRHQLSLYKQKKLANLETVRSNFARKHAQNVIQHELKQKQVLQERQQVFQDAFNKDLEIYKSLGSIPKIVIPKEQPSALLEEIQLELDDNELDNFLNDG